MWRLESTIEGILGALTRKHFNLIPILSSETFKGLQLYFPCLMLQMFCDLINGKVQSNFVGCFSCQLPLFTVMWVGVSSQKLLCALNIPKSPTVSCQITLSPRVLSNRSKCPTVSRQIAPKVNRPASNRLFQCNARSKKPTYIIHFSTKALPS